MQQQQGWSDSFPKGKQMMTSERPTTVIRADDVPGPRQGEWTYSHYAALPDDGQKYEIVNGVLYMSPAPNWSHQRIGNLVAYYLTTYVQMTGIGEVFDASDVELEFKTVVVPDKIVLLNESLSNIIGGQRYQGGPDLVVEIASSSTRKYDRTKKYRAYLKAKVKEYWIVQPDTQTVEVLVLEEEKLGERNMYQSLGVFAGEDIVRSKVVPHFPVQAQQFFGANMPSASKTDG